MARRRTDPISADSRRYNPERHEFRKGIASSNWNRSSTRHGSGQADHLSSVAIYREAMTTSRPSRIIGTIRVIDWGGWVLSASIVTTISSSLSPSTASLMQVVMAPLTQVLAWVITLSDIVRQAAAPPRWYLSVLQSLTTQRCVGIRPR